MGCCMAVKLLVCELVMAGWSAEWLGSLAELGAIQRIENREQVTVTQSHTKEIYTKHTNEGKDEQQGQQSVLFRHQGDQWVLWWLDTWDSWIRFTVLEKIKRHCGHTLWSCWCSSSGPIEMITIWKNSHLRGSQLGSWHSKRQTEKSVRKKKRGGGEEGCGKLGSPDDGKKEEKRRAVEHRGPEAGEVA